MSDDNLIEDSVINKLVSEIRLDDPSPEFVRTAVDRVKSRLNSRFAPGHSQVPPNLRCRSSVAPARWRSPMLRLGIAAAVVASFTVWQWMPTRQIGAGVVFGQVLDAVREATSMTYTLIEHPLEGGEDIVQFEVHGTRWLRLVSAGKGTRVIDLQDSRLLHFDHPRQPAKHATLTTFVGQAAQALQSVVGPLAELNDLLPIDGEPIGNKTIDGQAVTGFRVRRASLVDDLNDQSVWEVWADSETAQVVRVDIHHERDEGGSVTLLDFNFDVAFDDATFDFQPPPGYTIAYESIEELDSNDGK